LAYKTSNVAKYWRTPWRSFTTKNPTRFRSCYAPARLPRTTRRAKASFSVTISRVDWFDRAAGCVKAGSRVAVGGIRSRRGVV